MKPLRSSATKVSYSLELEAIFNDNNRNNIVTRRQTRLALLCRASSFCVTSYFTYPGPEGEVTNWFTIGLGLFAILICLPYAIYVVVNVVNADLLNLPETRLKIYLVVIVLVVGLMAYWAGANNHFPMTCGDFKIAGLALPLSFRLLPVR